MRALYPNSDFFLDCLRDALASLGPSARRLTVDAYTGVRAERDGWPTAQTIIRRFGTWNVACSAAGIRTSRTSRPQHPLLGSIECWECKAEMGLGVRETPDGFFEIVCRSCAVRYVFTPFEAITKMIGY